MNMFLRAAPVHPSRILREPLRSLAWASVLAVFVAGLGYVSYRWAGTAGPLVALPGSPWPYMAAWAVLGFGVFLLVRAVAKPLGWDGEEILVLPLMVCIRFTLAYRPGLTLLYTYGLLVLACAAGAVLLWRRHRLPADTAARQH
ncbi:hypothetical protein [Streptomyces sp. NPDC020817]|uniref:hypothetical protein n=1 Tax=Streptomyces sp. NPDC020817 TaxID=3365095 RepID=UPI0037A216A5